MKSKEFVCPESIKFISKTYEGAGVLIEEIKKDCEDGIIIWLSASGGSFNSGASSSYTCGLEYKGKKEIITASTDSHTANQSMILGAIDCAKRIQKSYRIYLVSATQLGFISGFKGKGINAALIQRFVEVIEEKGCQMTEVVYLNGAKYIKEYLADKPLSSKTDKKEPKEKYYAVAIGREPGIYKTWEECARNVNGYTGARFKKFESEKEALDYIDYILAVTQKN